MNTPLKILIALSLTALAIGGFLRFTQTAEAPQESLAGGTGTLNQLEQWKKSGVYITQNVASTSIKLTGLESSNDCLITDASGVVSTSACGSGSGGSNWTILSGGLRTSTSTDFAQANNFIATSTTVKSTFPLASTTALTATRGFITELANLTSNGFVKTSGGTGALSIDTSTYLTTVDISANTNLTGGLGLTLTGDDMACDTATTSVFGCLSSTDWNIFNNKLASTSIDTSAELATILTDETGTAGSVAFSVSPIFTGVLTANVVSATGLRATASSTLGYASSTALTVSGNAWLTYASTTGISGTNLNYTNGTIGTLTLTNDLTVANGGTGASTLTGILLGNGASAFTALTTSSGVFGAISDETGGTGVLVGSVSPALTGTMSFVNASGTSMGLTGNAWLNLASSTALTATRGYFTDATSTTSFFSALGTFTDAIINGILRLIGVANPTVNEAGEIAYNTATQSFSVATSTTGLEIPFAPPFSFAYASSSWTGTTTEISRTTGATFDELITTGICYANGTGKIVVGNGTASSTLVNLSAGTTTVAVNQRFNKNGTRMIFAMGTPTTLTTVNCTFDRYYLR